MKSVNEKAYRQYSNYKRGVSNIAHKPHHAYLKYILLYEERNGDSGIYINNERTSTHFLVHRGPIYALEYEFVYDGKK